MYDNVPLTSESFPVENSGPTASPMEPNFSENNFRFSGFETHQSVNSYEANERNEGRLSSEPYRVEVNANILPLPSEPSHAEQGRAEKIDQHCKYFDERTSSLSLPDFHRSSSNAYEALGSSVDKSFIPFNTFPSQKSENYTMGAPVTKDYWHKLLDIVNNSNHFIHFNPVELKPSKPYETTCNSGSGSADNIDDSPSSSPNEIKGKLVDTDDSNGCKRCNCKKSMCLKLYCDCFASKSFCSDSCACQGCYNRPQYQDVVLRRVQTMESRNPGAFAPKIIEPSADNSGENGGVHHTVISARHRRGCNCKKSKCSKKYCECFQSGVGCGDRCRCEGCENVNGQKEDHSVKNNLVSNKILSGSYNEYNEIANDNNLLHNAFGDPYHPHQMMTLSAAPSILFLNHGETAQNSRDPLAPSRPSYESSDANTIQVPYQHYSTPAMVMNRENYIYNGIRPQVDLQYYGNQNTIMNSFSPGFDASALHHQPNSAANNSVNPLIQSEGIKFRGGVSYYGRFSSAFRDGIPVEQSAPLPRVVTPPPNMIHVFPPFGMPSVIGSKFNPCNDFENIENKNPNDRQG